MIEPRFMRNRERLGRRKKVLVAILSCLKHSMDGSNQAIRDTWMRDAKSIPSLDCRFFIGDGSPTGQDEGLLWSTWNDEKTERYRAKPCVDPDIKLYTQREDEVLLHTPDMYNYTSFKLKSICEWGISRGYEFIFQCLTDTYVAVDRLAICGYENKEYLGTSNYEGTYVGGGPGYWLSKRSAQFLLQAPVTHWAYDVWTGQVMLSRGVPINNDNRYTNLDNGDDPPLSSNTVITSHIANFPTVYDPKVMYDLHRRYKG